MLGQRLELGLFWTFRYHLLRTLSKGLELEEDLILQLVVRWRRLDLFWYCFLERDQGYYNLLNLGYICPLNPSFSKTGSLT